MRNPIARKSVGGLSPRLQLRAEIVQKNEASARARSKNKLPIMRNLIARKSVGGLSPRLQLRVEIVQKNEASARARSTFISEGPVEWPKGWTKKIHERKKGATKGRRDCYWITPEKRFKLRSIVEVRKFIVALRAANGDERKAKLAIKNH
jgi:hypothetical protein